MSTPGQPSVAVLGSVLFSAVPLKAAELLLLLGMWGAWNIQLDSFCLQNEQAQSGNSWEENKRESLQWLLSEFTSEGKMPIPSFSWYKEVFTPLQQGGKRG